MNQFDTAMPISVGERRVAEMLIGESGSFGYTIVSGLLLDAGESTAQIDHVLIDRYGMLVIEVLDLGGRVRGKSSGGMWAAVTRGGQRSRFPNPLIMNDRRREALQRILTASGRNLAPEYIQSLVVLVGSDLNALRLTDVDSMRVVPDREVVDFVRARYDFEPNLGTLDAEEVAGLVSLLRSVNRSLDPDVVARHAATSATGLAFIRSLFTRSPRPSEQPPGSRAVFGTRDRYPDGTHRVAPKKSPSLASQALLLLVAGLLGWFMFFGGGLEMVLTQLGLISGTINHDITAPAPAYDPTSLDPMLNPEPDVALALSRMREADPAIYAALIRPDQPAFTSSNGLPTYTWSYSARSGTGATGTRTISITLDAAGNVVGVTGSQQ